METIGNRTQDNFKCYYGISVDKRAIVVRITSRGTWFVTTVVILAISRPISSIKLNEWCKI